MAIFNGKEGVWRTIGGRKVFIANGKDLSTAMQESGKFVINKKNQDIPVYRGHTKDNEYGEFESGTFFAVNASDASNFGEVEKVTIDGSAKIYQGVSTQDYCRKNNLMNKAYKEIEKYTGMKTLREVEYAMQSQTGNSVVDRNPNIGFVAFQTVAKIELEKEKYDGAHWRYEEDFTPEQYQIWNKDKIRRDH